MSVRCKMIVTQRNNQISPYTSTVDGKSVPAKPTCTVHLQAVSGPENKRWAKYTPNGSIQLQIDNPEAYDAFMLGETYFVDFKVAPPTEAGE